MTARQSLPAGAAPCGADRVEVRSSNDGSVIGSYPSATTADADAAVAAARAALAAPGGWGSWEADRRAEAIESLATAIKPRVAAIGGLVAEEVGTPVALARTANAVSAVSQLRLYARLAREFDWQTRRPARLGSTLVRRDPVGVVAAIVPWNFPISLAVYKLGPALAAGCTVVLKPAEETGLSSYLLAEAVADSELPDGVVTVLPGGREVGEHLVCHPGVDKVSFTGSTSAGRRVAALAGERLKPVTLELGGKSAAIVLPDVEVHAMVDQLPAVSFMNNGQTCTLCSRILVPRSRSRELVEAVTARAAALRVGSSLAESTQVGPLVSPEHRARVEGYLDLGRAEGATVTTGGGRPAGLEDGWFVTPTVFTGVQPSMRVAREEIFGPVVCVLEYDDSGGAAAADDAAVALANDSEFGLAGTVWSADDEHALRVAQRVEAGVVGANVWNLDLGAPFGGRKASGLGFELGPEAIEPYLLYHSTYVPVRQEPAT